MSGLYAYEGIENGASNTSSIAVLRVIFLYCAAAMGSECSRPSL